jgi:hypothetical protein
MRNIINNQILFEAETSKRYLDFIQMELTLMKNRLDEIIKEFSSKSMLETIEHYQSVLLELDEPLFIFRKDILKQIELIKTNFTDSKFSENFRIQENLRKEMFLLEKLFYKIKNEFNSSFSNQLLAHV